MSLTEHYPKDLAALVRKHIPAPRRRAVSLKTITSVIESAYFASMRTEEARSTLCTLTFADPSRPDPDPPPVIRDHRWRFFRLRRRIPLTVRNLAKLAPVARTSALAIAVHGDDQTAPFIWGLVDQEIHHRRTRVFEDDESFGRPGLFEVEIQGIGHVGAYSPENFIGALRGNRLVDRRLDALRQGPVFNLLFDPAFDMYMDVAHSLGSPFDGPPGKGAEPDSLLIDTIESWIGSICRILHRIQRYEHGGAVLLLAGRAKPELNIAHTMRYSRLEDALSTRLRWTAAENRSDLEIFERIKRSAPIDTGDYERARAARWDRQDADYATDGAVAFIAALAQVDGLVLMGPGLVVHGFGVEITVKKRPKHVFLAGDASATLKSLRRVEVTHFGTRHRSMFRYCNAYPGSVGFVVSQDGDIRAITKVGIRTILWENLNLYQYEREAFGRRAARSAKKKRS